MIYHTVDAGVLLGANQGTPSVAEGVLLGEP